MSKRTKIQLDSLFKEKYTIIPIKEVTQSRIRIQQAMKKFISKKFKRSL